LQQAPVSVPDLGGFLAHAYRPLALPGGEHSDVILLGIAFLDETPAALL
jgi:hypothetical protein